MEPSKRELRGIVPSVLAITGFLLMFAAATSAQQRYPIGLSVQASETTYTQQLAIEVGDSPNHQVRIYEIRRRHISAPLTFRDVKVTESWARGTSDYADYSGQTTGYSV